LGQLPRDAALALLLSGRAAALDIPADCLAADPAADAICEQLGDLALAIHMAAAYLAERVFLPLADFLAELHAQSIDHAALQALDQDSPTEHIQHIAQTIELSYRLLTDDEGRRTKDEEPTTDDRRPTTDDNSPLSPLSPQPSVLKTRWPGASSPWRRTARPARRSRWRCCDERRKTKDERRMTKPQSKIQNLKSKVPTLRSTGWSRSAWPATATKGGR
jgi:hypothetical protein